MKELAIIAENVSKQYRLGEVGTGTITHDLNRFWHKLRGKENPYLKIGDTNDRTSIGGSKYVWSLKDINFEIQQGDAVGIIGRNGAGKSTLLKLLSKVTKPTTGSFKVNGRVASLLEVGTGFNPEMTGRENIYLNGAILGMRRAEITRKFDEIVAFSGVERYIDTPVKRYSSGMYVRLAFAVAAHLESEILIVDEVLAVGDAEFQKKCLGKMGDVSMGEGRTVLFVSHNLDAVKKLCNKGILLQNGSLIHKGNIDSAKAMCTALNTPEAAMLEKGLNRIGQPIQDIREAMNETAQVEIGKLEKNMGILNITGRIAPMFGFIGTIIGVIKIFYDIALAKTVEIEVISTGLYQKMITSCSGLVVGVLAFVAYHWLNTKIDKLAHRMEESRMKFLDILNEPTN
jgi:ABC-type polysaccharide/polyol phosphate transport system ATPase subunit